MLARWLGDSGPCEIMPDERQNFADTTTPTACWDEAAALKRLDDDQELLNDMIDLFLTETPARLLELEDALVRDDLVALADAAHAIKGMAGHFCAEELLIHAADLEYNARHGNPADFRLMTKTASDATASLIDALQQKQRIPL